MTPLKISQLLRGSSFPSKTTKSIGVSKKLAAVPAGTPGTIPELLEVIFSFIGQASLRHTISLVCKQWYSIAHPLIIRRLYWNPHCVSFVGLPVTGPTFLAAKDERFRSLLDKLGSVQVLQCQLVQKPAANSLGPRFHLYQNIYRRWDEVELWYSFLQRLQDLAAESKLQVKELDLFCKIDAVTRMLPLLTCLPGLTRLRLENVAMKTIPLGQIFELCPGLRHLSIDVTEYELTLARSMVTLVEREQLFNWDGEQRAFLPESLSLESLRLSHVKIPEKLLRQLLGACTGLQELAIVGVECDPWDEVPDAINPYQAMPVWERLYQDIAGLCPLLNYFEYSTSQTVEEIMTLLPGLTGLGSFHIPRAYANHLTTLRIHGSFDIGQRRDGHEDILHEYLCEAPLLLHLYAPQMPLFLDRFDLKQHFSLSGWYLNKWRDTIETMEEGQSCNRSHPHQRIWACRNLKTLHVTFSRRSLDVGTDESSRLLFGYLSKVTPNLEELDFRRSLLILRLRGGLCLLQRMHRLRKLVIRTDHTQEWTDQDFEWMARTFPVGVKQRIQTASLLVGFELDEWRRRSRNPWSLEATMAKEKDRKDDREIASRYVYDGVDMKNVGLLSDLADVYKEKEAGKWACWPEMEWFEVTRRGWGTGSDKDLNAIVTRIRPDIKFRYHIADSN